MLIGLEEYNYFINCTAVQLMIFPKQTKRRERYLNTSLNINEIALEELKTKELNENTNKSTKFWLKFCQDWALAREYDVDIEIIQFCHANNKQVLAPTARPILAKFPNITRTINP